MLDVVVCGNLRGEISAFATFRQILKARDEGLVDRVVFSTWEAELGAFPHLADGLARQGVTVVTQAEPTPYSGSLVIQQMQFWRGLDALGHDAGWVLKTRTDKAFVHGNELFEALRRGRLEGAMTHRPPEVFGHRLLVPAVGLTELFAHNDLVVLAHAQDLLRCLNCDAAYDYVLNDAGYLPQEARWFLAPALARWPRLKSLMQAVSQPRLSTRLRRDAEEGKLADAPDAVFQHLGLTVGLTRELFGLFDTGEHGPAAPLADYLSGRADRPMAIHWGTRPMATSQAWLDRIEDAPDDPTAARLLPWMCGCAGVEERLARIDLQALADYADDGRPDARPTPRSRAIPASPHGALDQDALLRAFLRPPFDNPPPVQRERLNAALDAEAGHAAYGTDLLRVARALDAEARGGGDRHAAYMAYLAYMAAAWAWSAEAMDGACSLAFDDLLSDEFKPEALRTVYPIHVQQLDSPLTQFWYGFEHVWRFQGPAQEEYGLSLIRKAAGAGHPRAVAWLETRGQG